ncbi:MAG TPA: hypothetical protein VFD09_04285, partial [Thiopseudomonas sp.]|nr:hypothetical protein [Thiopseudomonas sp.]
MSDRNEHRMGNFIALKSAIINGEADLVKKFLADRPMLDIEKSYLLELAALGNNPAVIKLL